MINRMLAAAVSLSLLTTAAMAATAPVFEPLSISSAGGRHSFSVEVMRTEVERERGLMFRRSMPADQGMLFDFKTAAPVMMWMKNTYLPLDMVFIGPDGRVISTTQNAVPMSEKIISSNGNALGVLEVNAGTVAKLGIKFGDHVENAMFPRP